ncbi:hypothetical protein KUTeg_014683 [Tegillarca granosa]|uniref:Uncharacterized protein n=1 Tax=Tegillarca granosa TaxID=220873 RepID=A0ABQ9EUZ1_TEGGR|nr:hypothetical protein KUTeg_014683 [Tegillarca granosa]
MLRITRFLKGNIKNNRLKHCVNYTNTVKNGEKKETIKDPVNVGLKDGQKEVKEICVSTESELSHNEKQELNDITNSKPNVSETGKNKLSDNCVTKLNIDQNEKKKVQNDIEANIKDKQHNVYHKQSKFDMHIKRKLKNLSHQKAEISPNLGGLKYFQKLVETKKYNENLKNVVEDLDVNSLNDDDRSDQGVFKDITRNDFNKSVSDTNVHDLYEDTSLKSNIHKNKTEREMTSLPLDKETNLRASVEFVESEQLSHVSEELRSMSFIEELGSKSSVEEITTESLTSRSTDEDIKLESLSNISDGEVKAMLFKDFASASSDIDIASDSQASSSFKDVELETLSSNPDKKLASLPAVNNFGSSSSIEGVKPEGENDIQMEGEEDVESLYMYAGKYVRSEMKDKDLCNNLGDHLSKLSDNEENLSAREEVLSIIRNKEKVENHNVGESVYETEFVKKDKMPVSSFMPSSLNNTETLSKVVDGEKDFCPVEDGNEYLLQKPIKTIDGPLPKSYSLATYVEKSELLTNLVKLGVDLSKVERNGDTANFLVRLDYKRDVEPCLFFLRDIGIPDDDFGKVLTKNPFLCRERIEDLQTRVNYFASKKF